MYVVIWEFKVLPECLLAFIALCGPEGEWAGWFRESPHYIETSLLKSDQADNVFITIDKWESKSAYDSFYQSDQATFIRLDEKGDLLTTEEKLIGAYTTV